MFLKKRQTKGAKSLQTLGLGDF